MKAKLFVIEGIDGSGKSTIVEKLKQDFPDFVFTREPGGTDYSESLRNAVMEHGKQLSTDAQMLLMYSSRADNIRRIIKPAVDSGKHVVSDRFSLSTFVYQVNKLGHSEAEHEAYLGLYNTLNEYIQQCYDLPIETIVLDVDPQVAYSRVDNRGETNHYDEVAMNVIKHRADVYLKARGLHIHHIDANRTPEEVYKDVRETIINLQH